MEGGREWFQSQQLDARELQETLNKMEKSGPPIKMTTVQVASEGLPHMKHHADDRGYPHFYPQVHHLRRGDVHQKGDVANPAPLMVLVSKNKGMAWSESSGKEFVGPTSGRRSQLAHWIRRCRSWLGGFGGACHGQSPLAASLRKRARRDPQRLWPIR